MSFIPGSLGFDEFGTPFIIIKDQHKQRRLTGIDALKVCNLYGELNFTAESASLYKHIRGPGRPKLETFDITSVMRSSVTRCAVMAVPHMLFVPTSFALERFRKLPGGWNRSLV